ncbi:unnamed protein product [Cylicocyclus nassatus]|uniref:Uncharacterized protein n=1 Tax=Cylicocyclus nassatus TaxID=53992 RepID=A0AA36GHG6_CYLNA|nr:unnamed protein product [Cylicocyclus nassatus]
MIDMRNGNKGSNSQWTKNQKRFPKIKSIEYDRRIAFNATTLKVYEVRAPETFISFLAFIYDSVDEGEPPPR